MGTSKFKRIMMGIVSVMILLMLSACAQNQAGTMTPDEVLLFSEYEHDPTLVNDQIPESDVATDNEAGVTGTANNPADTEGIVTNSPDDTNGITVTPAQEAEHGTDEDGFEAEGTPVPDNEASNETIEVELDYITVNTSDGEVKISFQVTEDMVIVDSTTLNLRVGPSTETDIYRKSTQGEVFKRTGIGANGWYRLLVEGTICYAYGSYLSVYEEETSDAVIDTTPEGEAAVSTEYDIAQMTIVDHSKQLYSYKEMSEDITELMGLYTGKVRINTIGTTLDNRSIFEVIVGNPDAKQHIIIQAAMHGREYMTTLLTMKQLEHYLYYYDTGSYDGVTYKDLFEKTAIHLVPMTNPDGVSISQYGLDGIQTYEIGANISAWHDTGWRNGDITAIFADYLRFWKSNSNGVDINRNFSYGWDEYEGSNNPGNEKYKGSEPESEPESAALVELTNLYNPLAVISYHATGSILYWDYGQTGSLRKSCNTLVSKIEDITGYSIVNKQTQETDAAGYGDWVVMTKNVPSVTIEIGTDAAPLELSEFASIWNKNRDLWAALLKLYY